MENQELKPRDAASFEKVKISLTSTLLIVIVILSLAWATVWRQANLIKEVKTTISELQADKAELKGNIEDMRWVDQYFRAYSFQVVIKTLIKKARQYRVPINTALALMHIESGFDPFAISSTGDYGLLQMNEKTHKFDKQKIFDPEYNIDLGLDYLRKCYDQAGDWPLALAIYNAGKNHARSDHPQKFSESIFIKK